MRNEVKRVKSIARLSIILTFIFMAGCITTRNFESIPRESPDFQLSYEELAKKYPDVPLYEKKFRGLAPNTPLAKDLIEFWGRPDMEKTAWWYFPEMGGTLAVASVAFNWGAAVVVPTAGLVFAIRPVSPKKYVWLKENYCIETQIDTAFPIYRKRVMFWKWMDVRQEEKLSSECKEARQKKIAQPPSEGVKMPGETNNTVSEGREAALSRSHANLP